MVCECTAPRSRFGAGCTAPRSRFGAGTVSENNRHGVSVGGRVAGDGQVTVANAEEDKPQTVCKDNAGTDWYTLGDSGEIIGIPQEKLNA